MRWGTMPPEEAADPYVLFNTIPRVVDAERFRTLMSTRP